jgi:GLPGLI family protein
MTKFLCAFLVAVMVLPLSVAAQSGKATYEQTIKGKYREHTWETKFTWELIFTDSTSICKFVPAKEETTSAGGITIGKWQEDRKDFYTTFYGDSTAILDLTESQSFYQVTDSTLQAITWKFSGKQGLVGAYPCIEMVTTQFVDSAWIWFTPQIALPIGPLDWRGAPGLVLHVETDKGNNIITLKELDLDYQPQPSDFATEWPKKTKKISMQEWIELRNKNKERQRSVYGEY